MTPFPHPAVAAPQAVRLRRTWIRLRAFKRRRLSRALRPLALAAGLAMIALPARALDVNTATAEQLRGVRGMGPKTAQIIVKERERGGRFESMDDLSDRVRGIGFRRAQALEAAGLRVERQSAGGSKLPRPAVGASGGASPKPGPRIQPSRAAMPSVLNIPPR